MACVTDSRVQRDHRGPIRLGAAGAVAAGTAVGLELGLLAYWKVAGSLTTALVVGLAAAFIFGLFLHYRGIPIPRNWR
jgi:hypothetical protein